MALRIIGPKDTQLPGDVVINTTSQSNNWSRGLSPFYLGPIPLYENAVLAMLLNAQKETP